MTQTNQKLSIEAIELALREMLEQDKPITLIEVCKHLGIEPVIVNPHDPGEWNGHIDNKDAVYKHINKLHKMHNDWRKRYRESWEKFREGFKTAKNYTEDYLYKDVMTYKQFIDMRVPEVGLALIPDPDNSKIYIQGKPREELENRKKKISNAVESVKTRIVDGMNEGTLEDTRRTRRLTQELDVQKHLKYKKPKKQLEFKN